MNSDQFLSLLRSALKFAAGYLVAKGAVDQANAEMITGGVLALASLIWAHFHHGDGPSQPNLPGLKLLIGTLVLSLFCGCSILRTSQKDADGRRTTTTAFTFFDSKSSLAKLSTSNTDKTQSVRVSDLTQESSGSNAVSLVDVAIKAAVTAAVKSAVPVP